MVYNMSSEISEYDRHYSYVCTTTIPAYMYILYIGTRYQILLLLLLGDAVSSEEQGGGARSVVVVVVVVVVVAYNNLSSLMQADYACSPKKHFFSSKSI